MSILEFVARIIPWKFQKSSIAILICQAGRQSLSAGLDVGEHLQINTSRIHAADSFEANVGKSTFGEIQ